MKKIQRVKNTLLRKNTDKFPIFISGTPQFMKKVIPSGKLGPTQTQVWEYCVELDLDVIQVGHPSFYPVKVLELSEGSKYKDAMGRTHVIAGFYDNFCAPFPLHSTKRINLKEIQKAWESYEFPDPADDKWFLGIDEIKKKNSSLDDPLSIWGVINGPFEPTWQLMSDSWPEFFILYRRDPELAREIISGVAEYCIIAGQNMIRHGANAIRIGDDYGLNEGLMVAPKIWYDIIFPAHKKLIAGLKEEGGDDFPVILHSDGNIMEILDWLGEGGKTGIDALNPIQPDALDFKEVVEKIGNKLSMTGAFDLRYFLEENTSQTAKRLEDETKRLFNIIKNYNETHSKKTGFCIGPTHQIQPKSTLETFEKWVEIVHKLNKMEKT